MPRCQRTFCRLGAGVTEPGTGITRWICAECAEPESYETVREADLLQYAQTAYDTCRAEFGAPTDAGRPFVLLRGLRPECVLEPVDRRYDIYLTHGSDPFQLRLQIGHELFHRVCSEGRIFHWTHEMLACLVAVRLLRASSLTEYADQVEADYAAQAEELGMEDFLAVDPFAAATYPAGYYGRAYQIGLLLRDIAGGSALRRLARCLSPRTGQPDVRRWLDTLGKPERERILQACSIAGTSLTV